MSSISLGSWPWIKASAKCNKCEFNLAQKDLQPPPAHPGLLVAQTFSVGVWWYWCVCLFLSARPPGTPRERELLIRKRGKDLQAITERLRLFINLDVVLFVYLCIKPTD